jgi:hypothetical protein
LSEFCQPVSGNAGAQYDQQTVAVELHVLKTRTAFGQCSLALSAAQRSLVKPFIFPSASLGLKKIDVAGYPTDPKFLMPTLKIVS